MYPFLETIRFNSIIVPFIQEHQDRINRTFSFFYPEQKPLDLPAILREIKANNQDFLLLAEVVKCRLCYNETKYEYHLEPYQIKEIKNVVIKHVENDFDYTFKYSNRTLLNDLKGSENEILIVKNGLITDTSYANMMVKNGLHLQFHFWKARKEVLYCSIK
jgi:4-amino-4-deoxychorismate lyase